jgi:DNA helicase II / ATP-dependent DNA helicase PcrA
LTGHRTLLLGPPGCGKTERLLTEMERCLDHGIAPSRIAFVSFTRAAVREARDRAMTRFRLTADDLPWFRTLHSLVFRLLALRRSDVLGRDDLKRLEEITGEELTGHHELDAPTLGERGDALLFLDQTSRASCRSLEETWHHHGTPIDWHRLIRFVDAYRLFREDTMKLDFTDMLEQFVVGQPVLVPVDVAFLDEAQDLASLQWRVVERAFGPETQLYVAGDDDQAIYGWAGADAAPLLDFVGYREVLNQSYRLPRAVHALAASVAIGIEHRNVKAFAPRDAEGAVEWLGRLDEVDLAAFVNDMGEPGTWLLLARTRRQLAALAELARGQGVTYSVMDEPAVDQKMIRLILAWEACRRGAGITASAAAHLTSFNLIAPQQLEDANTYYSHDLGLPADMPVWHDALTIIPLDDREYYLSCLRRGEKLTQAPRVRISTVHGAKGAEADRVLVLTDVNARIKRGMELDPDAEQRVAYVAVTRARESLFLVTPRGRYGWTL